MGQKKAVQEQDAETPSAAPQTHGAGLRRGRGKGNAPD